MKNLGKKAVDKVTGFTGIITSVVHYLNGCTQYAVTPKDREDGKYPDAVYLDEAQVIIFHNDSIDVESSNTGGPQINCPKH